MINECISIVLALVVASAAMARPDLEEVLSATRASLGRERLSAIDTGVMLSGHSRFLGNDVPWSFITNSQGHFVESYAGPVPVTFAFDGEHAWIHDIGGETRELVMGERARVITAARIVSGAWLDPNADIDLTLDAAVSGTIRLGVRARDGHEAGSILLDADTHRPLSAGFHSGSSHRAIELEGWIGVEGAMFPRRIVTRLAGGSTSEITVESASRAPVFIRSPYTLIVPPSAPDVAFDAAASPAVEIERAPTGHLLVHPRISGQDLGWFIFDTGAGASVLDLRAVKELGLATIAAVPAVGIGGALESPVFRASTVTLGPATIADHLVVGLDLAFLDQHMGRPIAGIIGYGVLARTVVELDALAPAMSLHEPAVFERQGVTWAPLAIDERVACVRAGFEGHEGWFRLDTGSGSSTVAIHEPAVRELRLLDGRDAQPASIGGVGGMVSGHSATLAWFEIAGRRTENVDAFFADEPKAALGDAYTLGNLGGELFEPFRLIFDYNAGRIGYVAR